MDQEYIICSAILRNNQTDSPVLCKRHWDWIWLKLRLYKEHTTHDQQWFYTSKGRFVDRREAFKIAKRNWQLKAVNQIDWDPMDYSKENTLYSEYVW